MKTTLLLLLTALLTAGPLPAPRAAQSAGDAQTDAAAQAPLTNRDVLDMLKAGLAPEVVIAKIRNSRTNFDTSPAALEGLKSAGVPDAVLLAMARPAPAAESVALAPAAESVEVKIPDGTEVEVELTGDVSGQEVEVGDIIDLRVVHPLIVGGRLVVEPRAHARARVTAVKRAARWGRAGKLEWTMENVRAVDGQRVPARFTQRVVGHSNGGTVAVATVASVVILGGAGFAWALKKGEPAIIPAGKRFGVSLHAEASVKSKPAPAARTH